MRTGNAFIRDLLEGKCGKALNYKWKGVGEASEKPLSTNTLRVGAENGRELDIKTQALARLSSQNAMEKRAKWRSVKWRSL